MGIEDVDEAYLILTLTQNVFKPTTGASSHDDNKSAYLSRRGQWQLSRAYNYEGFLDRILDSHREISR